jgi:Niemann-Pick C1 protein
LVICVGIALEFCAHIARAFTFPSASVLERAPKHAFADTTGMLGYPSQNSHVRITRAGSNGHAIRSASAIAARSSRNLRAWAALVNVGASVFSGITITKVLGVAVLAFTRSKIFEIYYFRVWVALVICAAAHALIFLPVALSIFGGRGYAEVGEGGLERDLRGRREYDGYPALLGDDDDSDAEEF